ncbi:MAG: 1,4-alpha-glucan branching protein GlgB [Pyrinomonadaceae bacterium]|nr:1,4-alpha-glucan branching protein GlgB [Pyrinomonadaceae bacterium]
MNQPTVPAPELMRLISTTHPDPHAILGLHPSSLGMVVRVFRPEAEKVSLLVDGESATRSMVKTHEAGFFETLVEDRTEIFPYRLEVHYREGKVYTLRDPYSYPPTLGEVDLHLFGEGRHERVYEKFGAHLRELEGVRGVAFAVWAPNAQRVSVVGNFNDWDGRLHQMRRLASSGVWELFIPDLAPGTVYKYEIRTREGAIFLKADPYAFYIEVPPNTASVVYESEYEFQDQTWLDERAKSDFLRRPLSIYEVHLGSWRWSVDGESRPLNYRETAPLLADYVLDMGFTHVEFMPLKGHPYTPSWGYQVTSYYAPTARYGSPDDFRFLVDYLHQRGIGVILDWVPAHFPKDAWALGRFDGTALYEHLDSRLGEHPDWGTYIFNYGRNEVRNFLLANALYWLEEYHIDGLRLDAVASMLYLDYSRSEGEWIPNKHGGRENLEAISLLRELNEVVHGSYPGVLMIAEESTAWGGVSRPTYTGGLGFGYKWNMGWMHDTLEYFSKDPIHRRFHHNKLTFGLLYAWTENFILPLSHDEVVHGKGSLIDKMPGDRWQKFANLRALYAYMWAHPGKKLLFMGGEFGQWSEWRFDHSLDWHLLDGADHRGLQNLMRDINRLYRAEPALWEMDSEPAGFQWIDANNGDESVFAFMRTAPSTKRQVVCVCNFTPVVRQGYRVGLPKQGKYREVLNTDASVYGGSNVGNGGSKTAEPVSWHGQPYSASLVLPPLATVWFEVPLNEEPH